MALFIECMPPCAQNVLDIADIVRDRRFISTSIMANLYPNNVAYFVVLIAVNSMQPMFVIGPGANCIKKLLKVCKAKLYAPVTYEVESGIFRVKTHSASMLIGSVFWCFVLTSAISMA